MADLDPPLHDLEGVQSAANRLHQLTLNPSAIGGEEAARDIEFLVGLHSSSYSEVSVSGLLSATRYCYLSRCLPSAVQASRVALRQARGLGDKPLQRKAHTFLAIVQAEVGNFLDATQNYSEAAAIAEQLGDAEQMRPVLNNLASLFCHLGQYADGLKCLRRAVSLKSRQGPSQSRASLATSFVNISHCCIALKQYSDGRDAAGKAIDLLEGLSTADDLLNRVLAEVNLARIALETGDFCAADARYRVAVQTSSFAQIPRGEHAISVLRGLMDVHVGRVEAGLDQLRSAVAHAKKHLPSDLPDTLGVCVNAFDKASRPDAALTYLHELLTFQKELHRRGLIEQLGWLASDAQPAWGIDQSHRQLANTAVRLGSEVRKKIDCLAATAATAALSSGYDLRRTYRVARLAELFAQFEHWDAKLVASIKLAAQLTDIGMIAISERVLSKASALSRAERKLVEEHTRFGAELLESAHLDTLLPCVDVARFHHERWDGSGPFGLEGASIPPLAQVVGLCDTFDAMTHRRPWRGALSVQAAVRSIELNQRNLFEPGLAVRFAEFVRDEFWRHDDFEGYLGEEATQSSFVCAREHIAAVIRDGHE